MLHPMTHLAIHYQAALARSHAEIAEAVSRQQPETPVSARSVHRILGELGPNLAELIGEMIAPDPGRPSIAEPFRHQVATALESESYLSIASCSDVPVKGAAPGKISLLQKDEVGTQARRSGRRANRALRETARRIRLVRFRRALD